MAYIVGQQLWYQASSDHRVMEHPGRLVTITKIGRRWLTVSSMNGLNERIDKDSLWVDGGEYMSPGRCYLSEADYYTSVALDKSWTRLLNDLSYPYTRPTGVTKDQIVQVRVLLGLKPEKA